MKIKEMFKDDINRQINGVVQVEQKKEDVIEQELREYVVTSELKKHFVKFFDSYSDSFDNPTDNVGVWITGFFGSGKSHFLKMLSYLLSNKIVAGKPTIEYFREKFDDELTFMNIEKSTSVPTETILFNIDVEGSINKDDTAVLRVFSKVFYDHLGFYGNDLKVAKLEQFITKKGKMDTFKQVFEDKNGDTWENTRNTIAFFEDDVVETLVEVLGMSETAARHWFDSSEEIDLNIGQLVDEINEYVNSKPEGFRLLFMIDEAGQYIGTNTSMLLNLQTLIEKIGSTCRGKVWIVATGQEALDDMIKVRQDEFSRIMARFKVRLSLTSSSVGEVIEKRLLTKTESATNTLEMVYENNDSILRNLYAFDTDVKDIRGYSSEDQFVKVFPFVPYQFVLMQKVFNEIRKHGHAGKHQSSGERSMLNGFQESAQKVQERNELSVVPLYEFYDTLHSFLDTAVRGVVERAEKAANDHLGLTNKDVDLLKLLYLIRYIDDVKSNVENITILMADSITVDKLMLKKEVQESLERLQRQNYVARNGEIYTFLTDEEQDIAREIKNTPVDTAKIISGIGNVIFSDIYMSKKFRYEGKYDFSFDEAIDNTNIGSTTGGMKLRFVTIAADPNESEEHSLLVKSKNHEAICVLSNEYPYFEYLEMALKIEKYASQKGSAHLPETIEKIIRDKRTEANRLRTQVKQFLEQAIIEGKYYIDGQIVSLSGSNAKDKINKALEYLVKYTYTYLNMIEVNHESDNNILSILNEAQERKYDGRCNNQEACDEVENYLGNQAKMNHSTSMAEIHSRYSSIPYGWREIDIAAVIAQLIRDQKVTIKYSGMTIQATDHRIVELLRKKNEIGKTMVSKREEIPTSKLQRAKKLLREYFEVMDLPNDEDGLIHFINSKFGDQKIRYSQLLKEYNTRLYPGRETITEAINIINDIKLCSTDNIALINKLVESEDDLLDNKDDMQDVENFFATQKNVYDNALNFIEKVREESDYFENLDDVNHAISEIKRITTPSNQYKYSKIKDLNTYISIINDAREKLMLSKRNEVNDLIEQCITELEFKAQEDKRMQSILEQAINTFSEKRNEVLRIDGLALLDAKKQILSQLKDQYISKMDKCIVKDEQKIPGTNGNAETRNIRKQFYKQVLFPNTIITNEEDVNHYVEEMRTKLLEVLKDVDELTIK